MTERVICVMGRVLDQDDGLGVYAFNLLDNMMKQDKKSLYTILLRTEKNMTLFDHHNNARTLVLPSRIKSWWDQITVMLTARKLKADIIFNPKFSIPLFSGRSSIFVLHASDWYVNPGNYEWWDNIYIRIMLPLYFRKAKHLLSISDTIRDDLVKYAKIDSKKVTATYAAPSPHFKPITANSILEEFKLKYRLPDRFILSVCRAYHTGHGGSIPYPGGNIEGLLQGYDWYRNNGGNLPLVIVGEDIDKYLRERGFSIKDLRGVCLTGFIPHEEIVKAYNLADIFVLTTLYESFSLPLVEAMASGCPVIAPNTGACPEVAGDAACLVDPRDSIAIGKSMIELLLSNEVRNRLRNKGFKRASIFTWDKTASRTLEVFDAIVPT